MRIALVLCFMAGWGWVFLLLLLLCLGFFFKFHFLRANPSRKKDKLGKVKKEGTKKKREISAQITRERMPGKY